MLLKIKATLLILLASLTACEKEQDSNTSSESNIHLVPSPAKVLQREGNYLFNKEVRLAADFSHEGMNEQIDSYLEDLLKITSHRLKVQDLYRSDSKSKTIEFVIEPNISDQTDYEILIANNRISIKARDLLGIHNAWHSCAQLLAKNWKDGQARIPSMRIIDQPTYHWRGVLVNKETNLNSILHNANSYKLNLIVSSEFSDEQISEFNEGHNRNGYIQLGIISDVDDQNKTALISLINTDQILNESSIRFVLYDKTSSHETVSVSSNGIISEAEILTTQADWTRYSEHAW